MKDLVIVMAGDSSLHEKYACNRDFDLWVCHWGNDKRVASRFGQSCDRLVSLKGQKWALVRDLGRIAGEQGFPAFSSYGYVFLPDDDLEFPGGAAGISNAFAMAREIGADIFQPAVSNEHYSKGWESTRRVPDAVCHATTLAEVMMPAYSGAIFEKCVLPLLHILGHIEGGWGIEPLVARFAETVLGRPVRTFVLDETPAIHTRPVGKGTSDYSVGKAEAFLNPMTSGVKMKELERFRDRAAAARYAFPPMDEITDKLAIRRHLKRVEGARRIHEMTRTKSFASRILKSLQKLAARHLEE